jgi:hypothetical protein
MTYPARAIARLALPAFVIAPLFVPGCGLGSHTCPGGGSTASVMFPAAQSSPIERISTDPQCVAWHDDVRIYVSRSTSGSCQVLVELMNGDTYAFSVGFEAVSGAGDCPGGTRGVGNSDPVLVDAGAGSPG